MKIASLLAAAVCPCLLAQEPNPTPLGDAANKSTIAGIVLNSRAGVGIPKATVSLICEIATDPKTPCGQTSAIADDRGRFEFKDVPAGRYMVMAFSPKFTSSAGPMPEITVPNDGPPKDVRLDLLPSGAISGTVVDSTGQAQPGLQVTLFRETRSKGVPTLFEENAVTTEAKGQFEFHDLSSGKYIIVAGKINLLIQDQSSTYVSAAAVERAQQVPAQKVALRTFYPGVLSPDEATLINCEEGCDDSGLKLKLQSAIPGSVTGRAIGFDPSRFPGGVSVTLTPFGFADSSLSLRTRPETDGRFQFSAVPSGHYIGRLVGRQAIPKLPNATVLYQPGDRRLLASEQEIFVGQRETKMDFVTPPQIDLAGQIIFPEGGDSQSWPALKINLITIGGDPMLGIQISAETRKDGSFSLVDCPPTKMALRIQMPAGIFAESVVFNERDVSNSPIDLRDGSRGSIAVKLRKGGNKISGSVDKPSDDSATSYAVVRLIPTNYTPEGSAQIYRAAVKDDAFSFDNVPPGTYNAIAVANPRDDLWDFPEFLKDILSSTTAVEVKQSASQTLRLQLVSSEEIDRITRRLGI